MITKQVIFMDTAGCVEGGILLDDRPQSYEVVCGCCGGILKNDEFIILYEYPDWCNVSNEICGTDDLLNTLRNKVEYLSVDEVNQILCGEKKVEVE